MRKFKFNIKLTAFLVSLFLSLILVIVGSNNKYCLSFGFILMGLSLSLFVWYNNEKTQKMLELLEEDIDAVEQYEIDEDEEMQIETEEDMLFKSEEERIYVLKQLYVRQSKLKKQKNKFIVLFNLCGFVLIILGFIGLF